MPAALDLPDGLTQRPLVPADAAAVTAVIAAQEVADVGQVIIEEADIVADWQRPGYDVSAYGTRAMAALEIARGDGGGELSIDLALARLYLERDRPADAVPLLRRIVIVQPQFAEGSILLAEAQEATGSPEAAIDSKQSGLP